MRNGGWIVVGVGVAVVIAATVGWRGSRPASPIAAVHSDGVTVVPATGTLRRVDVLPTPRPASSPLASTATLAAPMVLDTDDSDRLPALLSAQARDPAWAPAAEARLRVAFADVPHLGAPPRITCAATLCAIEGVAPNGLSPARSDALTGTLQGSALARTRSDFAESLVRIDRPEGGPPGFTVWLVRR